jgi:hypothetical protein
MPVIRGILSEFEFELGGRASAGTLFVGLFEMGQRRIPGTLSSAAKHPQG